MGAPKNPLHVPTVVFDLTMREAERRQAGCGVRLVADVISGLGDRRSVIFEPVSLDHQAEIGPEEIDLESIDLRFGQRRRQADSSCDPAEEDLELGVRQLERVLVEELPQPSHARLAGTAIEGSAQGIGIEEVVLVRLVDCSLERRRLQVGCEVDQSPNRIRYRDAIA